MNLPVSLIGAPTDIGAGTRGASMGPEALRVANIGPILAAHGLDIVDRGNLTGPSNPWQPPDGGYRHLDADTTAEQHVHHRSASGGATKLANILTYGLGDEIAVPLLNRLHHLGEEPAQDRGLRH